MLSNEDNVSTMIAAWKLMSGRFAGATLQRTPDVATAFANVPLAFMNISAQARPAADSGDLRAMLATMRQLASTCPHSSFIALCEPWLPEGWQTLAEEEDFTFALNVTGMSADSLLPPRRPTPALEYRRVRDESTASDLAQINAKAYGLPMEMCACVADLQLWQPDTYAFVAYRDGQAVTTAAALPVDGVMYLAMVATLPEEHGKGFAEAVMRQAIEHGRAAMGVRRILLHATDVGQPLYRAMGFATGCKIPLLSPTHS